MITIYHNPRCSKSREALKILTEAGADPSVVEYLKTPPDVKTLEKIIDMIGCDPEDIVRKKEAVYKELGFNEKKPSRSQLLKAMVKHPILIERPIVMRGEKAVLGRPPENVRELL
jgi:arsenate reductase